MQGKIRDRTSSYPKHASKLLWDLRLQAMAPLVDPFGRPRNLRYFGTRRTILSADTVPSSIPVWVMLGAPASWASPKSRIFTSPPLVIRPTPLELLGRTAA